MTFSIITPSFNQLDWLQLCIASVRDQTAASSGMLNAGCSMLDENPKSKIQNLEFSPLCVEHIIQDAGSPGIEEFAREVGADFYRDGKLVFAGQKRKVETGKLKPEVGMRNAALFGSHQPAEQPEKIKAEVVVRTADLSESPEPPESSPPDSARAPAFHETSGNSVNPVKKTSQFSLNYSLSIYCESDSGMYDAINRGLVRSTGEICAWLNCDEQYLPGALSLVESWFDSNSDVEWMYADAILVDESGNPISYRRTCAPSAVHIRLCHLNTLSCSTFFKRQLVDEGFLFDTRYRAMGDAEWVYRIVRARRKVGAMREATSVFTLTGDNLGTTTASLKEAEAWRREKAAPPTWLTLPCKLIHRMGKVFAGAYQSRMISMRLYTKASPLKRMNAQTKSLGFGWPKND